MNKDALVSIAMCSYNGERFIKEQINSILNQTYENIELIIVDDCSKDKTVEIIQEYLNKDNRIKFYKNENNIGFVKNFEKSISLCTGEYIALADQDDIWKNNKLEVFVSEIKENTLIYSDAILIDKDSKILNKELIRPNANLVKGRCNKAFIFTNCVSGNTLMFKKELIPYILPIPEQMSFHDIWIAFVASTIGTIIPTEESFTFYRRYTEQVTHHKEKNYYSILDKLAKKENFWQNYSQSILNNCIAFKTVNNLDGETVDMLNIFIEHYSSFNKGFFSFKMYKSIKKHGKELFAIKRKGPIERYLIKYSTKNKLLKIFMY